MFLGQAWKVHYALSCCAFVEKAFLGHSKYIKAIITVTLLHTICWISIFTFFIRMVFYVSYPFFTFSYCKVALLVFSLSTISTRSSCSNHWMTNRQTLLVFISNLAPTNFSFWFFSSDESLPRFFFAPVSNLIIISYDAIFATYFFP